MLQQKSKVFKLKFHLAKVQASSNKVSSRVHAYVMIENHQIQFKGSPQLKKNLAIFGCDLQYENFMIGYDEVTGLYEQKRGLVVIEFETMGAYIKVGELSVNLGEILNEKKYRVVNEYPLSKCYDKTAKIKLGVDFIPQTRGTAQQQQNSSSNNNKNKLLVSSTKTNGDQNINRLQSSTQQPQSINNNNTSSTVGQNSNGYYKNPTGMIKSRLAQQQNVILQQRVYEYQKRMDKYRSAQNELSQKMSEQIQRKDEKISQLTIQVNKLLNKIHLITLQGESMKVQIKALTQQKQYRQRQCRQYRAGLQQVNKKVLMLQKQLQSKTVSIQNILRTKQSKQKHLSSQITKYTNKYSQSQQWRNKIIFQLQTKLKLQLQRKDQHYEQLITSSESKYVQMVRGLKERNRYIQNQVRVLQESNSQQENRIKALTLQLSKSLSVNRQRQQQMVYMKQQINRMNRKNQLLSNQLQSLSFSHQNTITQLFNTNQLNKQLALKLQHTKTELSLSNQTITQLNQTITQTNKQLQVHSQRQYYMNEHYQQQLNHQQNNSDSLKLVNQQLHAQLYKINQQLKINTQKLSEEQTQTYILKTTLENCQKQILTKNTQIIKLNQQLISSNTINKNLNNNINQLQLNIQKLQQQKIYLNQNIIHQQITLENQKSLEWTYKIQSLQNDIQILLDKHKSEKELIKEQHKKQQNNKNQQINNLSLLNKKLKQNIEDLKDKLNKRQNYLINLQKTHKSQKDKSSQLQRQINSLKQTLRSISSQKQTHQQNARDLSRQRQSHMKSITQLQGHKQRLRKQILSMRSSFQRVISVMLQYMVRRYSERVSYHQIGIDGVDSEMMGYVNVGLKKYCQQHNRTRELVKQLQEWKKSAQSEGMNTNTNMNNMNSNMNNSSSEGLLQSQQQYFRTNNYNQQRYLSSNGRKSVNMMNRLIINQHQQDYDRQSIMNRHHSRNKSSNNSNINRLPNIQRALSPSNNRAIQSQTFQKDTEPYRLQIDRLKKEQSQFRVKIKCLQQEIQKQERVVENIRFESNRLKGELQQSQDQISRLGFVLRKKDKMIKELQCQVQQMQKQNLQLKSTPQYVIQKARQKLSGSVSYPQQQSDNNNIAPSTFMAIRQLQSKLNLRQQELLHVSKQLQALREQYLVELNNTKKLQTKLKEKTQRILALQKELQQLSSKLNDNKDKQNIILKKMLSKQQQQKYLLEQKTQQLQSVIKQFQQQLSTLQQKNKQLHQQFKSTQITFRRNLQSSQYEMNDKSTFYQTEIMQLKSQLSQLENKLNQFTLKNSHLTQTLIKKNTELQTLKDKLILNQKLTLNNQEQYQQYKNKMHIKLNSHNDKIRELQSIIQTKQFHFQQTKFAYQGKVLDLQRQIDDYIHSPIKQNGSLSPR